MAKKYSVLTIFAFFLLAAGANAQNPSIAVILDPNGFVYIKNIGDEPLTNIFVTTETGIEIIEVYGEPIPVLQPGQQDFNSYYCSYQYCYETHQIKVHATTQAGLEIVDLSDHYDYYGDEPTLFAIDDTYIGYQDGTYVDANQNNIVDIGDHVAYTYQVDAPAGVTIFDNNSIIANDTGFGSFSTTGIHYLTEIDIAEGYVYNSAYLYTEGTCSGFGYFIDPTPCSECPQPSNCANCVITPLTSLLPNKIFGMVGFDAANDGCTSWNAFTNRLVRTTNGINTYANYSNSMGAYLIMIPNSGDFETTAMTNLGNNFSSNPASHVITSSGSGTLYDNNDFCISSATNYSDLSIYITPLDQPRPGFMSGYRLTYQNLGSTSLSGTLSFSFDETKMLTSVVQGPTPVSTTGMETWTFTDLLPFQSTYVTVYLMVFPPPVNQIDDELQVTLTGEVANDANLVDNIFNLQQTVVSSYDPNDKIVLEGAYISPDQANEYLHYVTRFQNTGNASATTVVIKETLDPHLDWNTFEPLGASHEYILNTIDGNDLTCTFPNIGLPPSSVNESLSQGWLAYRIKLNPEFELGDVATARSDIYFDFNPPIVTNTVTTQIAVLNVSDNSLSKVNVYPNPVDDLITIDGFQGEMTFQILDLQGKLLNSGRTSAGKQIDVNNLGPGLYLIKLASAQMNSTLKFIKN